MRITII